MAILVSGGAGYIGSHTCIELLNAGYDVVVADNYYNASPVVLDRVKQITGKDFRFYQADMTKHEDVEKIFAECPDITAVIQFAAYKAVGESVSKPIEYYYNNLNCTLVILDVMLPGEDGFSILKKLRAAPSLRRLPIIMITAKSSELDTVRGLDCGADDYITKPFSMEELTFRIEAILRRVRGKKNKESNIYKIGKFTFDTQKQILATAEKQTKLTTKESELLGLLCAHANEILQRDFALKTIWIDDNYFNARSMDVYITKLRKHLKEDDSIEIINIHGKGYKLITPEAES